MFYKNIYTVFLLCIAQHLSPIPSLFPLHSAVKAGIGEKVEKYIQKEYDVNQKDIFGKTPLYYAAGTNNTDILATLIEYGADINAENGFANKTALHKAAKENCVETTTHLLTNGAHISRSHTGDTPLHVAAKKANYTIIKKLIRRGSDPNALRDKRQSPLHCASQNNNAHAVTILVQHGAHIHHQNNMNIYPIDITDSQNIRNFLRNTEQKNYDAINALQTENQDIQTYIENGTQLPIIYKHIQESYQKELLNRFRVYAYYAHRNDEFLNLLHTYKIPQIWLEYTVTAMHSQNLKQLLKTQSNLREYAKKYRTKHHNNNLLHIAAKYNCIACVKILLGYINPMLTNGYGETAYDIAKQYKRKDIKTMMREWNVTKAMLQQPHATHDIEKNEQQLSHALPPEIAEIIITYSMR